MNLGNPIGQQHTVPSAGFDQGEHGAGIGLSGGHGHATSQNTQSGGTHTGSGSASGGLPTGTPIADKFTHQGQGTNSVAGAYAGGGTDDALTGQSNAHRTGAGVGPLGENLNPTGASAASGVQHGHQGHSHSHGQSQGQSASSIPAGVSGAYAGGNTRDALTGESHAQRTGAGVGPLGENLPAGHTATSAALAGTAAGAAAGAGVGSAYGTGVGPQGGSGGHYSSHSQGQSLNQSHGTQDLGSSGAGGLASGTGAGGSQTLDAQRAGAQAHASGENVAAKLGLAGAGAGVGAGAAAGAGSGAASSTSSGGAGHYGTATTDSSRGEPVSDPKELDHGGRHGLVYQESTGKYVHRHEVDERK